MIKVKRLAHATLASPNVEKQTDYWSGVMGLQVVERSKDRALLATKYGQEAICLETGAEMGLSRLAFEVDPGTDLNQIAGSLRTLGMESEIRSDITPGVKKALVFKDPNGTVIEVFETPFFHPLSKAETGISTLKLGHVAYRVQDVPKITSFYCDVLGFRASDLVGERFSFLRCGVDHHTINFARYDAPKLHHIAFEVKDWAEVQRGCEVLHRNELQLVWGPLRHVVGHNVAAYHRNPDDIRVEIYCEMDLMKDEALGYFEPRPWHEDFPQRPKTWPEDTWRSAWGFGSFGSFPGYP